MATEASPLEGLLRRDRAVLIAGLAVITVLSWLYLFVLAARMGGGIDAGMTMPDMQAWGAVEFILMFVMWVVMMVAMMVPSAAPLILIFARMNREKGQPGVFGASSVLLLGYLLAWVGFSLLATLAQWGLHNAALLSPMMVTTSSLLGGTLLVLAGIFQFTPMKRTCLTHCQSPLGFLMSQWQARRPRPLVMGLRHGLYCVGCCWILMVLLFVFGVMNLLWIAALALFVLLEKVVSRGPTFGRVAGVAMMVAGIAVALR